jgi:hypothetical protein
MKSGDDLSYYLGGDAASATEEQCSDLQRTFDSAHLRAILREHWITNIVCDHDTKTDRACCSCSAWRGNTKPSIGAAVDDWIDHVLAEFEHQCRS